MALNNFHLAMAVASSVLMENKDNASLGVRFDIDDGKNGKLGKRFRQKVMAPGIRTTTNPPTALNSTKPLF